jgi:hypothetical protein
MALSEGLASCGKGLPVAGLGHGALGLLGGLCVKVLCVGGCCCCVLAHGAELCCCATVVAVDVCRVLLAESAASCFAGGGSMTGATAYA